MKLRYIPVALAAVIAVSLTSCNDSEKGHDHDHDHVGHSHDDHDHDHSEVTKNVRKAGPNGGRILHKVEPHLEFFVTEDRKVKLTALDDSLNPVAMATQVVRVTGGERSNPISMGFVKEGESLISDKSFPAGDDFPLVVQIQGDESAAKVFEKFTLDFSPCPTCDHLEYACTCDHGEGHDHDHDHDHSHD
jgi:hypothetical protein